MRTLSFPVAAAVTSSAALRTADGGAARADKITNDIPPVSPWVRGREGLVEAGGVGSRGRARSRAELVDIGDPCSTGGWWCHSPFLTREAQTNPLFAMSCATIRTHRRGRHRQGHRQAAADANANADADADAATICSHPSRPLTLRHPSQRSLAADLHNGPQDDRGRRQNSRAAAPQRSRLRIEGRAQHGAWGGGGSRIRWRRRRIITRVLGLSVHR